MSQSKERSAKPNPRRSNPAGSEPVHFYRKGSYTGYWNRPNNKYKNYHDSHSYKPNRPNQANDNPKPENLISKNKKNKNQSDKHYNYWAPNYYNKKRPDKKSYNNKYFVDRRFDTNSPQISEDIPSTKRNESNCEFLENISLDLLNCVGIASNADSIVDSDQIENSLSIPTVKGKELELTERSLEPQITVKPISDLVKSELLQICVPLQKEIVVEKEPNTLELAEKTVNKIAQMDKTNIRNVINNPDSRFNEALLIKSQQRFREVIRKQLESMYNNHNKQTESNNFEIEADAIVDSVYLPKILYNILDDTKEIYEKSNILLENENSAMNSTANQNKLDESKPEIQQTTKSEIINPLNPTLNDSVQKSQDLMTRIRNSELVKSKSDRNVCGRSQNPKNSGDISPITDNVSSSSQIKEVPSKDKNQSNKRTTSTSSRSSDNNRSTKTNINDKKGSTSSNARKSHRPHHDSETYSNSGNSNRVTKTNESCRSSNEDEVMIINSSSDSSSCTSGSSSSDSDSNSSTQSSSCSSADTKIIKRKSLEDSVLENFKHLMFSTLSAALQKRFNNKKTKIDQLNFIADTCLPIIKRLKLLEPKKIKNFKYDLSSKHNDYCLKTLLHSMLSLYHKDKKSNLEKPNELTSRFQDNKKSPPKLKDPDPSLKEAKSKNHNAILNKSENNLGLMETHFQSNDTINPKKSQVIEPHTDTLSKSTEKSSETAINENSKIIAEPASSAILLTQLNHQSGNQNNRLASSKETAQSALGLMTNVPVDTAKASNDSKINSVNLSEKTQTNKRLKDSVDMYSDNPNNKVIESGSNSAADSCSDCDMENVINDDCDITNEIPERSWKSPGEKKCIENAEETTTCSITHSEQTSLLNTRLCVVNPIELSNLNMFSLNRQNNYSESILQAIREIDLKIMKVHQNKIQIDDMILKLQKDKMEADMQTIQLQNEKIILINTAMANSTMSITTDQLLATHNMQMASTTIAKDNLYSRKRKLSPKEPKKIPFSTPFSEKLRNRKKRCQRDILLEDTANTIFNDDNKRSKILLSGNQELISENTDDLFRLTSRRLTKSVKSKISEKSNCPSKINNNDPPIEEVKTTQMASNEKPDNISTQVEKEGKANVPFDYAIVEPGFFEQPKSPISHIKVVDEWVLAASEDGIVYKFNILTKVAESKFTQHTEAITSLFIDSKKFVYTTSLDGYLKVTLIENFGLGLQSINVKEPLQSAEFEWDTIFLGSRKGNVFTYNVESDKLSSSQLCNINNPILALKASKEGPRKILIISSRGNNIEIRDASCGILLRSFCVPENLAVHSMILNGNNLYCGTHQNLILKFDFCTGNLIEKQESGYGAVSIKQHSNKDIYVGCYDGYVYVYQGDGSKQPKGRIAGSGKMILSLEIAGNKIMTSSKDNTMQLLDIPQFLLINKKD